MSPRRRIVVAVCAMGLYVGLAALSGHLSPTARGPLLDGLGPSQPYRWVNPPGWLASTNQQPAVGTFVAHFKKNGLQGQVFVTGDAQATVIVPGGAFPPHGRDTAVVLMFTPVDPAALGPLPAGGAPFGNAYRIAAAYRPSGAQAPAPSRPIDLILLYPDTTGHRSAVHTISTSADGSTWTTLKGTDTPAVQEAEGKTGSLGYAVVSGRLLATSSPDGSDGATGNGTSPATIVLVIAVCVLLVGVGLLFRSRSGAEP